MTSKEIFSYRGEDPRTDKYRNHHPHYLKCEDCAGIKL
jgi:hypothetical protein